MSPKEWGAAVDYDKWKDLYTPDDAVALHHGGSGDYAAGKPPFSIDKEMAQLRSWEKLHMSPPRNWRGLAYGWAVGQTGQIYRVRGWATYGAHTGDLDGDGIANNKEIVPIIFLGSGNHHDLSPAAEKAIEELRRFIEASAPLATYLYGHQELKGTVTSCPGPRLMTYVKEHRKLPPANKPRFEDVPFDHPMYKAIEWLAREGITSGTNPPENTLFSPDRVVTREEFATFLKRYNDRRRAGQLEDA